MVLEEQRIGVLLLEGVCTADEALGLEETVTIGGIECRVLLPVLGPVRGRWPRRLAGPPTPGGDHEPDPGWRKSMEDIWGDPNPDPIVIRAVGIIPVETTIPPGDEHIEFDHAVAQWRHLLRDWLTAAAEGPTDFPDRDYYGATIFGSSEYDGDYDGDDVPYRPLQRGHRYRPKLLSARAWSHAIEHAGSGQQPPLARTLMTTATRAATTADWRVAVIDAATATEAALTAGLVAQLSATLSPRDVAEKLKNNRMLGKRIALARTLNMPLPAGIQDDLVEPRNAAMHQGTEVTGDQVRAAITAAWAVVHQYDPLPVCCHESESAQGA
jgi:hypothetical protein